jgi:hypothetical protein
MMYGWLWRHLPGPALVRVALLLVGAVLVLGVCFEWVFPALSPFMPFNDTTVGE